MTESFSATVKDHIRKNYNWTCTICLNALPVEGSHCAHIFDASKAGEEQVADAVSLGLMDPTEPYSRKAPRNGVIQCPTCHLGYFTSGRLVLSPPMPVLEWITDRLEGATDSADVWQIFSELELSRSPKLLPYKEHYSLIPLFHSKDKELYELYCNVPLSSVLTHSATFETISGQQTGHKIYRIFSYRKAHLHSQPGIVRFTPTVPHGEPIDYWNIPVSCHVILYIFLQRTINRRSRSPEVALGHRIYAQLLKLRGTPFPIIAVEAQTEFLSLEQSSLAGNSLSAESDTEPVSTDPSRLRPRGRAMSPAGDNKGTRHRSTSGKLVPTNQCCGRESKGNYVHMCTVCYMMVLKSSSSTTSETHVVVPGAKVEDGSETKHSTLAGWISGPDVTSYSFGVTLTVGAMLGMLGTLILRRRML
ncbi:hypothetical protein B0H14DRAFT_3854917 [Mycena olivaceomarginata]|nr:hypothetical protein B0H14DRAFT_3854917 [Mycena olivaceomarginata]